MYSFSRTCEHHRGGDGSYDSSNLILDGLIGQTNVSLEALDQDENIVDADSENQKWNHLDDDQSHGHPKIGIDADWRRHGHNDDENSSDSHQKFRVDENARNATKKQEPKGGQDEIFSYP